MRAHVWVQNMDFVNRSKRKNVVFTPVFFPASVCFVQWDAAIRGGHEETAGGDLGQDTCVF